MVKEDMPHIHSSVSSYVAIYCESFINQLRYVPATFTVMMKKLSLYSLQPMNENNDDSSPRACISFEHGQNFLSPYPV